MDIKLQFNRNCIEIGDNRKETGLSNMSGWRSSPNCRKWKVTPRKILIIFGFNPPVEMVHLLGAHYSYIEYFK